MVRELLLAAGAVAALTTTIILAIHLVFTIKFSDVAGLKIMASTSAALESLVLIFIVWFLSVTIRTGAVGVQQGWKKRAYFTSCSGCLLAAIISAVALSTLGHASTARGANQGRKRKTLMAAATGILGLALATQLLFCTLQFANKDELTTETETETGAIDLERKAHQPQPQPQPSKIFQSSFRSVPYIHTKIGTSQPKSIHSINGINGINRGGGSFRSQLSASTFSSRSSLTCVASYSPTKAKGSFDSRKGVLKRSESFESWHGSTPDSPLHQFTPDCPFPSPCREKCRSLETIPASPTATSPDSSFEYLLPPPPIRRSVSFGSLPVKGSRTSDGTSPADNESHIHPLFRSDSPTPPPLATPGTRVLASPGLRPIVLPKSSIQSLRRKNSEYLHRESGAASPLSRQSSFDVSTPPTTAA